MLSAHSDWLAQRCIASTIHLRANREKNKMASRFASVTEEQILSINEADVPNNTEMATKFGLTVFNGKLFNLSKLKILCRRKLQ